MVPVRVAVLQPWFTDDATKTRLQTTECVSLGYLTAALRAEGIPTDPLDAHLRMLSNSACVDHIARNGYGVVGISCSAQRAFATAADLARRLRERLPRVHVTLGGQFVSQMHELIARTEPAFHSIVRGEGERTFPALVRRVEAGGSLAGLPGVTFRDGDEIVVNPPADRITDLDTLPFPDRSYLEQVLPEVLAGVRWVAMIGSRGCIYKCTFCSVDRPRAARSPENIVAEMCEIHDRWGARKFMFNDDLLIGASAEMQIWAGELADRITEELPGMEVWAMTRADAVTPDLFARLARAGFRNAFVGVESGADAVLKRFRKGTRAAMNDRAIRTLESVGITPEMGFIMLEPRMSWGDLGENLAFLHRVGCFSRHNLTNRLNVYHGAPMYERGVENGEIRPSDDVTERYLYAFDDPLVGRFSDASDALQRHGFAAKMEVWASVNASKELRMDFAASLGSASRELPEIVDLVGIATRVERQEADAWLVVLEELYERLGNGDSVELVLEVMPELTDALLEPVRVAAEALRRRVDELRRRAGESAPSVLPA
jgi:anaerobic magnesium-protoporphyrin IX monomethyl ester cyclase